MTVLKTKEAEGWKNFEGFTLTDLKDAFNKVAEIEDWRGAIDRIVPGVDLEVTKSAIRFFTATEPEVEKWTGGRTYSTALLKKWATVRVSRSLRGPLFRVKSIGYRAGPAGP